MRYSPHWTVWRQTSGYDELKVVPIVPVGHSAMATFPWNFAAWNPERALAVISYHGDAPRTNLTGYGGANLEWGRTRNIDGIPGLRSKESTNGGKRVSIRLWLFV